MAILSASVYGNPNNEKAMTSTTRNETGVMIDTTKCEWTAGGYTGAPVFSGKNARYWDNYGTSNSSAKAGDALGTATTANPGCARWHQASYSDWVDDYWYNGGRRICTWY